MKMSKTSGKNKEDVTQHEAQSSGSEDEDEDMDDTGPREETPDLYRNSALGMYGGVSAEFFITFSTNHPCR
jgi:E3 ubiquitin-protein ligase HUWE1